MKPAKEFDCVRMKTEIQERLLSEVSELGEEEAAKQREQRLLRDPTLGSLLQRRRIAPAGNSENPGA